MNINSFDALFYTLTFVAPGYILFSVLSLLKPYKVEEKTSYLLKYFTLSCLNYGPWVWLVYLIFKHDYFLNNTFITAMAWFWIIFISPIIFAFIIYIIDRKYPLRTVLFKLGITMPHSIPDSWDYIFSEICKKEPVWVLVTLTDGVKVGGYFGSKSFASTEPNERDLFIEDVYRIDEKGDFVNVADNKGILICKNHIKTIEFMGLERSVQNG